MDTEERESSSATVSFDATVPMRLLQEWKRDSPEFKPRHKITIPLQGKCYRALELLELTPQYEKRMSSDALR